MLLLPQIGATNDQDPFQADHLACYKIRDRAKIAGTTVDIDPTQFGFAADCQVLKAVEFCGPAERLIVDMGKRVEPADLPGPASAGDHLCYSLRCPKDTPVREEQEVTDPFGNRIIDRFKLVKLCTPAIEGPAPVCGNDILERGEE